MNAKERDETIIDKEVNSIISFLDDKNFRLLEDDDSSKFNISSAMLANEKLMDFKSSSKDMVEIIDGLLDKKVNCENIEFKDRVRKILKLKNNKFAMFVGSFSLANLAISAISLLAGFSYDTVDVRYGLISFLINFLLICPLSLALIFIYYKEDVCNMIKRDLIKKLEVDAETLIKFNLLFNESERALILDINKKNKGVFLKDIFIILGNKIRWIRKNEPVIAGLVKIKKNNEILNG